MSVCSNVSLIIKYEPQTIRNGLVKPMSLVYIFNSTCQQAVDHRQRQMSLGSGIVSADQNAFAFTLQERKRLQISRTFPSRPWKCFHVPSVQIKPNTSSGFVS